MAWYRTGTVTVTNGSATVTGAGTDFVANASAGEAFLGADGRVYEVAQVVSATQLQLSGGYQGASAGGQGYALLPTQSLMRDLALGAAELLGTFAAVRDGVGQGLFADGTVAAPGLRFAADQDTGIYRLGANTFGFSAGGAVRMQISPDGANVQDLLNIGGVTAALHLSNPVSAWGISTPSNTNALTFIERQFGSEKMRLDAGGHLLVGVSATTGGHHIAKLIGQGSEILGISNANYNFVTARFFSVGATNLGSAVECALAVGTNPSTGRSLNAGGTINASGADYAEYMAKAEGCGTIAPGDVCGVDRDGKLTRTWGAALSFVVKSTDPAYVGGDTWSGHLPPRPQAPIAPTAPIEPGPVPTADDPEALAQWRVRADAYPGILAAYRADQAAWQAALAAYEIDLAAWQAQLETARQCVDRIAFAGQVPVNVDVDTLSACEAALEEGEAIYLVAVARGAGIGVAAVREGAMTLPQYMRRLGKVWAIRDGRPWVDVQHG